MSVQTRQGPTGLTRTFWVPYPLLLSDRGEPDRRTGVWSRVVTSGFSLFLGSVEKFTRGSSLWVRVRVVDELKGPLF